MADGGSFDWKRLHIVYGGRRLNGRAKGTSVSLVMNAEANTENAGVDGTGYFIMSDDTSGRMTVLLTLESEDNDYLSECLEADRQTPGGLKLPLMVEDENGRTVFGAPSCKINKLPDLTYSDGPESRAWVFVFTSSFARVGGMPTTTVAQQQ